MSIRGGGIKGLLQSVGFAAINGAVALIIGAAVLILLWSRSRDVTNLSDIATALRSDPASESRAQPTNSVPAAKTILTPKPDVARATISKMSSPGKEISEEIPGTEPAKALAPEMADETREELAMVMDDFLSVRRLGIGTRLSQFFAVHSMVDLLDDDGLLTFIKSSEDSAFTESLRIALGQVLARQATEQRWTGIDVADIEYVSEAIEFLTHVQLSNGRRTTLRWRAVHDDEDGWLLTEVVDPQQIFPLSVQVLPSAAAASGTHVPEWMQSIATISSAYELLQNSSRDAAQHMLASTTQINLPDAIRAARWIVLAASANKDERFEESAAMIRLAPRSRIAPSASGIELATALLGKGDAVGALSALQQYETMYGEHARSQLLRGMALERSGRMAEATRAYKHGLSFDPHSIDLLARSISCRSKGQLEQALSILDSSPHARELTIAIGGRFIDWNRAVPLAAAAETLERLDPKAGEVVLFRAHALRIDGNHAAALAWLSEYIADVQPRDVQRACQTLLLECALNTDDPQSGYEAAIDKAFAFEFLCDHLLAHRTFESVETVLDLHRRSFSKSPWISYYTGLLHAAKGLFDEADRAFMRGMAANLDETARALFRDARIQLYIDNGKALAAYDNIGPRSEVFAILARTFRDADDFPKLTALVASHRKNSPGDRTLPIWDAEIAALADRHANAIEYILKSKDTLTDARQPETLAHMETRLIDSLLELNRVDEALAIAQHSTRRDGDPWFEAVVYATAGQPQPALHAFERCLVFGYTPNELASDPVIAASASNGTFDSIRSLLESAPLASATAH